jgi:hypothetical protein
MRRQRSACTGGSSAAGASASHTDTPLRAVIRACAPGAHAGERGRFDVAPRSDEDLDVLADVPDTAGGKLAVEVPRHVRQPLDLAGLLGGVAGTRCGRVGGRRSVVAGGDIDSCQPRAGCARPGKTARRRDGFTS